MSWWYIMVDYEHVHQLHSNQNFWPDGIVQCSIWSIHFVVRFFY